MHRDNLSRLLNRILGKQRDFQGDLAEEETNHGNVSSNTNQMNGGTDEKASVCNTNPNTDQKDGGTDKDAPHSEILTPRDDERHWEWINHSRHQRAGKDLLTENSGIPIIDPTFRKKHIPNPDKEGAWKELMRRHQPCQIGSTSFRQQKGIEPTKNGISGHHMVKATDNGHTSTQLSIGRSVKTQQRDQQCPPRALTISVVWHTKELDGTESTSMPTTSIAHFCSLVNHKPGMSTPTLVKLQPAEPGVSEMHWREKQELPIPTARPGKQELPISTVRHNDQTQQGAQQLTSVTHLCSLSCQLKLDATESTAIDSIAYFCSQPQTDPSQQPFAEQRVPPVSK